jgi:quinol monooxygenase YgiN
VTDEVDMLMVTMEFSTNDPAALAPILAKYVVMSRGHDGCRNIDLCSSTTTSGRLTIVQKWESPEAQRTHFDSPEMVEMAQAAQGLLTGPPRMDLLDPISAHDLS